MQIHEITLLTSKEYNTFRHIIPNINKSWWLKDISSNGCPNIVAGTNGNVFDWAFPAHKRYVRPALRISGVQVCAGEKLTIFAYPWTVLETIDNVTLVLCDIPVTMRPYDNAYRNWEQSNIKVWLEQWLAKRMKTNNPKTHQQLKTMNQVGLTYLSNKFLTSWATPMSLVVTLAIGVACITAPLNYIVTLPVWTRVIAIILTCIVTLCAISCTILSKSRTTKVVFAGHILNTVMLLTTLVVFWCNTTICGYVIMLSCETVGIINMGYLQLHIK